MLKFYLRLCLFVIVTFTAACSGSNQVAEPTLSELYKSAVMDAVFADEDEIRPLLELNDKCGLCRFDKHGRVLLLSFHHYPESYPKGAVFSSKYEIWGVTDKEFLDWYGRNKDAFGDFRERIKMLLGLPPQGQYTHVTAFWVKPLALIRPAVSTDVMNQVTVTKLNDKESDEYKKWFYQNIIDSYFNGALPWTRLGYTYDWNNHTDDYGLTEFLVRPGVEVRVMATIDIQNFYLNLQKYGTDINKLFLAY